MYTAWSLTIATAASGACRYKRVHKFCFAGSFRRFPVRHSAPGGHWKAREIRMSGLFKKPTPREQLRESQRSIGHNVRDLERELAVLKREEAKLVKEIKDAAAKGNVAGAKILAKNLVRIRNQQTKLLSAMAGLRGVSVSMQTAVATGTVAQSLGQAGQAMAAVGQTQDLKAVQKTAMQFAKESETMEMKGEMMDGALESAMGDDVEEEMDEVMERVMDEIGVSITTQLKAAPQQRAAAPARQQQQQQESEEDDLLARLAALK